MLRLIETPTLGATASDPEVPALRLIATAYALEKSWFTPDELEVALVFDIDVAWAVDCPVAVVLELPTLEAWLTLEVLLAAFERLCPVEAVLPNADEVLVPVEAVVLVPAVADTLWPVLTATELEVPAVLLDDWVVLALTPWVCDAEDETLFPTLCEALEVPLDEVALLQLEPELDPTLFPDVAPVAVPEFCPPEAIPGSPPPTLEPLDEVLDAPLVTLADDAADPPATLDDPSVWLTPTVVETSFPTVTPAVLELEVPTVCPTDRDCEEFTPSVWVTDWL